MFYRREIIYPRPIVDKYPPVAGNLGGDLWYAHNTEIRNNIVKSEVKPDT